MAIESLPPMEADHFVKSQKKLYPGSIKISHYQLRHLIASPAPHIVYYVSGKDVHKIDTRTNERIQVTTLPFEVYCMAAGHGWFCAGGDVNSYFAALRIPEGAAANDDMELGGFSNPDRAVYSTLLDSLNNLNRPVPPRIRVEKLGGHIYNSISIHQLCDGNGQDDVVAIITNNDHSVRMYSLTNDLELETDNYAFNMNHASISPDGRLLAVVGDHEFIFFYLRVGPHTAKRNEASGFGKDQSSEWELLRHQSLHKPQDKELSAYFTTAWSQNGRLFAAASEDGFITVFDVDAVRNEEDDCVAAIVPSSRPRLRSMAGAVRTMCFAPDPWDLLIWAEHSGRVCIGDLRYGLQVRQTIELNPKGEDITTMDLHEAPNLSDDVHLNVEEELENIRRQRSTLADSDSPAPTVLGFTEAGHPIYSWSRLDRQSGENGLGPAHDDFEAFTEQEWRILDGIRTSRQRDGTRPGGPSLGQGIDDDRPSPRSIHYNSSGNPSFPPSTINDLARIRREAAALGSLRDLRESSAQGRSQDRPPHQRRRSIGSLTNVNGDSPSSDLAQQNDATPSSTSSNEPRRAVQAALGRLNAQSTGRGSGLTTDNANPSSDPAFTDLAHLLSNEDLPPTWPTSSWTSHEEDNNRGQPHPNMTSTGTSTAVDPARPPSNLSRETSDRNRLERVPTEERRRLLREMQMLRTREQMERLRSMGENDNPTTHTRQIHRDGATISISAELYGRSRDELTRLQRGARRSTRINAEIPGQSSGQNAPLVNFGLRRATALNATFSAMEWQPNEDRNAGVRTTGCVWAGEGSGNDVLFVGTEEGIFALQMNYESRKFWPSVEVR